LEPSIAAGPNYCKEFNELKGYYLIDFPGMFDSKDITNEISIDLALQRIIVEAKSTKILLLMAAN